MIGKSFKDLKEERLAEGVSSGRMETPGNEQYCVYFARAHVVDHETQAIARGPLKIGRAKYLTTVVRGRNQSGIDFRTYARIIVETNEESWSTERDVKSLLEHKHLPGAQNQTELYSLTDAELKTFLQSYNLRLPKSANLRIYI